MKRSLLLTILLLNVAAAKSCAGNEQGGLSLPAIPEEEPENFSASFLGAQEAYEFAQKQKPKNSPKWKMEMAEWLEQDDAHSSEAVQSPRKPEAPAVIIGAVQQKLQEKLQEQKSGNENN